MFLKCSLFCMFLLFSFSRNLYSQDIFQAFIIDGKDTFTMWQTFVTYPFDELRITSQDAEMSVSTCMSKGYFPTWRIENDSLFLIELTDEGNTDSINNVNLAIQFKERFINKHIFAKEITYQIQAKSYKSDYSDSSYLLTLRSQKIR
jgi:hypothetical protein